MEIMKIMSGCSGCGNTDLVVDTKTGDKICSECGLVDEEKIMVTDKTGGLKDAYLQFGAPQNPLLLHKGLRTYISFQNKDASGKKLSPEMRATTKRLRREQYHYDDKDRREKDCLEILNSLLNSFPNVSEVVKTDSANNIRRFLNSFKIAGYSFRTLVCSVFYFICRREGMPISLREIKRVAYRGEKGKINRFITKYQIFFKDIFSEITSPKRFVEKFASEISPKNHSSISQKTKNFAWKILSVAEKSGFTQGKDPRGLAAAALYIACKKNNEKVTQKVLGEVSKITEATIRNQYKNLIKFFLKEP